MEEKKEFDILVKSEQLLRAGLKISYNGDKYQTSSLTEGIDIATSGGSAMQVYSEKLLAGLEVQIFKLHNCEHRDCDCKQMSVLQNSTGYVTINLFYINADKCIFLVWQVLASPRF